MRIRLTTVTIALVSVPAAWSQSARTGVSNPEPVSISAQGDEAPVEARPLQARKPSAAVPATPATGSGEAYGPYVPYRGGAVNGGGAAAGFDPDAAVVTSVEEHAGEVREGTLLRVRTRETLSTVTTAAGSRFTAELTEPVEKDGRVVLPVGALVEGKVTEVHGGRRISGAATLHLEPRSVTLPDGTHYEIHAQLIDTDQSERARVDHEGTLVRRDHPKEALAAVGLATGGAAAAGALLGGGVGAAVGAGVGAGAGTILWLKQDRQAVLPQNALLVFSLTEAMPVMPSGGARMSRVEPSRVAPEVEARKPADGRIVE